MARTVVYTPWWVAIFALPFWAMWLLVWGVCLGLWVLFVWSVRAVVWLVRTCANLRFPRGVDSVGDE